MWKSEELSGNKVPNPMGRVKEVTNKWMREGEVAKLSDVANFEASRKRGVV